MKIGITGGIGSGKTYICEIFNELGIPIYNADLEAKRLMEEDEVLKDEIIQTFGPNSYDEGRLNRSFLADLIFRNPKAREQINAIVHPRVLNNFTKWRYSINNQTYGMESAILIDSGFHTIMDSIIAIEAPNDIRIRRIIERDNCTKEQALIRMNTQSSDAFRRPYAQHIIINDGKKALLPQIEKILITIQ